MNEPSSFDAEFELDVLAQCLKDQKYMREAMRVLDRRHFVIAEHGWIWRVTRDNWRQHSELPTPGVFVNRIKSEFQDDEIKRVYIQLALELFKRTPSSPNSALEELRRFVRTANLQIAIEKSVKAQERGEWEAAWEPIREAVRFDVRKSGYKSVQWIEEFDERQRVRKHRRENPQQFRTIPTGFKGVDERIGGMQEGELITVMATTNRGKSVFVTNCGRNAVARGYYVLHISTEMGVDKVAQRYDSLFTQFDYRKFKRYDFTPEELKTLDKIIRDRTLKYRGKLMLVSTPLRSCDIELVNAIIDDARAAMPRLDMLILDSGDHLQQRMHFEKHYMAESANWWDLKDLAEAQEMVVLTTMQAKAEFETKVADTRAAAGAYDKSRISDVVLSLNIPIGQKKEKRSTQVTQDDDFDSEDGKPAKEFVGDLEIYGAKVRDDESKFYVPIDTHLKTILMKDHEEKSA